VTIYLIDMDVVKAIRERRSIRKYKSDPISDEDLNVVLQAGRWAPSASNKQPWHFVVVRDEQGREELAKAHAYGRFMAESPVVVVVLGDPAKHPKYYLSDPHNAVQNMLLAAYSLGLGTCWMGVRDTDIEPAFRRILGIPESLRVICCVSLGYPDQKRESTRQEFSDLVSWEQYGAKSR
jgi:nitroreductase